jgi:ATP-dependent DNA ligase
MSRVHWVEPKLVAQIKCLTWTADNLLRQTVYVGLREDKPAEQVRREAAGAGQDPISQEVATLTLVLAGSPRCNAHHRPVARRDGPP